MMTFILEFIYGAVMNTAEQFWWKGSLDSESGVHEDLFTQLKTIESRQGYQYIEYLNHMRLYGQTENLGMEGGFGTLASAARPQINIIQICVNTLVSKIGKTAPRATFLTHEGDWSKQQMAKKLTQFSAGQFYRAKTYTQSKKALLDAAALGTGFVKNYIKDNEIVSERVLPLELIVDDKDAIYGTPRVLFQKKLVSREDLKAAHPNFARQIDECPTAQDFFGMSFYGDSEMIVVVEAWKLPSSKKAKDGRHFIGIQNATLWYKEYKRSYFPFSKIVYQNPLTGYRGDGVAKLIMGLQIELNRAIKAMSQAVRIMGVPRILYEVQSKIVKQHFNNEVGSMIEYSGTKPDFINPISISADVMNWTQFIIQSAFQEIGISQMSASGLKPAGLNSKVAMREFNDIETERFASFAANWEELHMDIARQQIELAKDLAKDKPGYGVWAKRKDGIEFIKWSDVNLSDDDYISQVYPTSFLSGTPSGQLDRASDLIELQLLTPEEAGSLLEFPDVSEVMSFKNAAYNDIQYTIESLLEDKYVSPEPFQNLQLGITYVQSAYLKYKNKGVPEETLQLLRRWIDEAMLLTNPSPEADQNSASPDQAHLEDPTANMSPEEAQAALQQIGQQPGAM